MKLLLNLLFYFSCISLGFSQSTIAKSIKKYNENTIPYIYVKDIENTNKHILLDTRKKQEYNTSHIENAVWVGYDNFNITTITDVCPNKNAPIIVYCSIGVRSEDIGEKLKKAGYTNVKNLYGGIFDWKNQERPVYNNKNAKTDSVHVFSKQWGKLLTKGIKVYD